jgi:hypothetical protein
MRLRIASPPSQKRELLARSSLAACWFGVRVRASRRALAMVMIRPHVLVRRCEQAIRAAMWRHFKMLKVLQ